MSIGVGCSNTTSYNPEGNGQCERYNGIVWKAITLALKTKSLPDTEWEYVLAEALHSIRSLLCTATNCTPHERMFNYHRRSTLGNTLPSWLLRKGPVLLRRNVRNSKYDPLCDEVELLETTPSYAHIKYPNGTTQNVSLKHLAPLPVEDPKIVVDTETDSSNSVNDSVITSGYSSGAPVDKPDHHVSPADSSSTSDSNSNDVTQSNRRSARERKQTEFYQAAW